MSMNPSCRNCIRILIAGSSSAGKCVVSPRLLRAPNLPSTSQQYQNENSSKILTIRRFYQTGVKIEENAGSRSSWDSKVCLRLSGVGIASLSYVAYHQYERIKERECRAQGRPLDRRWSKWKCFLYTHLPLRLTSRFWGWLNDIPLHPTFRAPLLGLYVRAFGCRMDEAELEDLEQYENLSALFNRRLKATSRPIDTKAPLVCYYWDPAEDNNKIKVSPADGVIQSIGTLTHQENDCCQIEQVKGITYSLEEFLGSPVAQNVKASLKQKGKVDEELHYCVVYLAPGDYHAFHSPADWTLSKRYHFTGELLSVSTWMMKRMSRVLCLNERVLLTGTWPHGSFFSFTAVGATNVGNIYIDQDPDLLTNVPGKTNSGKLLPTRVSERRLGKVPIGRGDRVGEFRLGSSVVLIFTAPKDAFQFTVKRGDRLQYGQPIGRKNQRGELI